MLDLAREFCAVWKLAAWAELLGKGSDVKWFGARQFFRTRFRVVLPRSIEVRKTSSVE